jgi:hypothetical protein
VSRDHRDGHPLPLFTLIMLLPSRLLCNVNSAASRQVLRLQRPLIHPSLPRSHLSWVVRHNSTGLPPPPTPGSAPSTASSDTQTTRSDLGEPRLSLTFTCTAGECSTRSTHQFTKRAYERGIVLIECPGCKARYVLYILLARVVFAYYNLQPS